MTWTAAATGGVTTITAPADIGSRTYTVADGTVLVLDPHNPLDSTSNPDLEETVVVSGSQIKCQKSHTNPVVVCRGNPGPWANKKYHMNKDKQVVLYWAIID